MLLIAVEVGLAGAVCDVDCLKFSGTVGRQHSPATRQCLAGRADRTHSACCGAKKASTRCRSSAVVKSHSTRATRTSVSTQRLPGRRCAGLPHTDHDAAAPGVRSDWAPSLMTWRTCSDADKCLVIVTPRILSSFSLAISGSGGGGGCGVSALRLEFSKTISLVFNTFSFKLFI